MRKGLWSPDEDERLVRCITKYVNGSWSDIARKAGLDRCGKSCRRRWMNHLRPDLKRGKFSMDEINLIVQLQEALGNRWSDIASHLEGRTDNDVKNLWNTQIKKRLSQLKAQNLSSSVPLTFSSNTSTHAACSTNNSVGIDMGHLANMGLLPHRTVDEYENAGGMQVLRFGGGTHGNVQDYIHSCSASSCEGSDPLPLNDQENSSWKPTTNALTLPQADVKPHDYNNILWSSASMQGNIDQQMQNQYIGAEDHSSLLMRPCGSSSILMSSGISRFMQPSQITPALDERAVASGAGALFDLQYQEGAQLAAAPCTNTIASLESSSSYVPLKTDNGVVADDNEECCSLQHNLRAVPPTLITRVPESQDQMARNGVGSSDNLLSANVATINTSSLDEIAHRYINDHHQIPQQHTGLQFSRSDVNVLVNIDENIYTSRDKIGITAIHDSAVAELAPANVIIADSDHNPSLWGEGQNQYLYQPPSNYANMQGAGAAHGWDYVSECSNVMPHLSFADWCKQLVHDQY